MKATWIQPDGTSRTLDVPEGHSLMEAAQSAGIAGILGECGGTMSCATCHVHVDPVWKAAAGAPGDFEEAMLDIVEGERTPASRLSCQIHMKAALDGIVVHVPAV